MCVCVGGAMVLSETWRRDARLAGKRCITSNLRQVACFNVLARSVKRRFTRSKYATLTEGEGGPAEAECSSQRLSHTLSTWMWWLSILVALAALLVAVKDMARESEMAHSEDGFTDGPSGSGLMLLLSATMIGTCAACAKTAAQMYSDWAHTMQHPKDAPAAMRRHYLKVDISMEDRRQRLVGLLFRPSTDGLECLLVEHVKLFSPLSAWNHDAARKATAAAFAALQAVPTGGQEGGGDEEAPRPEPQRLLQIRPGSTVVAVNDAHGDVGLMQLKLTEPVVTLWVRQCMPHASVDDVFIEEEEEQTASQPGQGQEAISNGEAGVVQGEVIGAGAPANLEVPAGSSECQQVAVVGFEDEAPQVLVRWVCFSFLFGWMTLFPVLFVQPREGRLRQQLLRQYLLKPAMVIMPLWVAMWLINSVEASFGLQLCGPFWYFLITHMLLPPVIVWQAMKMQAADEVLVLEQRKERSKSTGAMRCIEDPVPMLHKELICLNPVVMVWMGAFAAIPIVVFSVLTPLTTARGKLAQGHLQILYLPCIVLQVYVVSMLRVAVYADPVDVYVDFFGLMLALPCLVLMALGMAFASRHCRKDMDLCQQQRLQRAAEVATPEGGSPPENIFKIVDTTEALYRDFELVLSA